jgi:hypothetical protein
MSAHRAVRATVTSTGYSTYSFHTTPQGAVNC